MDAAAAAPRDPAGLSAPPSDRRRQQSRLVPADDAGRLAPKPLGSEHRRHHAEQFDQDQGRVRELVGMGVAEARHHVHLLGPTGTGKSTLLLRLILADAIAGRGVVLIDPHGDLALRVLERLPASCRDRLVLIDPEETEAPAAWNVLEADQLHGVGSELVTEHLVATLHRLYSPWWGPRLEDTLRAACLTLTHPATKSATQPAGRSSTQQPNSLANQGNRLGAGAGVATLADIPRLLTHRGFRERVTGPVRAADPGGLGAFWDNYNALSLAQMAAVGGPVLSKLRAITSRRFAIDLLGVAPSTLDMGRVLDGGILIARLPKGILGEDTTRLVGSLLLTGLWQAATARSRQPEDQRLDAAVYVDECHNFLHLPIGLDDALAEARSYRLSWTLAHQHLGQLPKVVADAIDANTRNKIYFTLSPFDAHVLARHTAPHLDEDDLAGLAAYQIACRLMTGHQPARPFTLTTLPAPPSVRGGAAAARTATRSRGLSAAARAEHHALRRRLEISPSVTATGSVFDHPGRALDRTSSPSRSLSRSLSNSPERELDSEVDTREGPSAQVSGRFGEWDEFATDYTTPGSPE